jgi:hypothetical protein
MSLSGTPTQAATQNVVSGVDIQTSCYGGVVPVVYGETRMVGNLADYDDFQAIQQKSSSSGKGGGGGGKSGGTTTDYKASFIFALCEGPVSGIYTYYSSKSQNLFSSSGLGLATGSLTQTPWGAWTTKHPAKALAYAGTAYVYAASYDLGDSAQLPNFSFEVTGLFPNAIAGLPDADPKDVVTDVLTNPRYGVGFPSARLGDLSVFSGYCRAAGLVVSPLFSTQQDAASQLNQIVQDCNAEFVWSGTELTIVPYGDQNLSANGATYTAPSAPLYSLADNDFIDTGDGDPVQCSRKRPSDAWNSVKVEWLNRTNQYNAEIVESRDQASIEAYGLRGDQPSQSHHFCVLSAATMAATLRLQRQAVRNQYTFTLGWRYCLLDPMDIVEISDPGLGLANQWVRILSLEEDDSGNIKVTAEEYIDGTGAAPLYSYAAGAPFTVNYNSAPGSINTPFFYEPPPPLLAQGVDQNPQIWIGASGGANWGGCHVWLSLDGSTYDLMGTIDAPCRQGFLTAALPAGSDPDTSDTLSVDLSESLAALTAGTTGDADDGRTLCCVDGELISYSAVTLTAPYKYNLGTYLRRGQLGSIRAAHATGATFCRLDDAILKIDLPTTPISYVGKLLYLKFTSFNPWGGGEESLAGIPVYTYTPTGAGVAVAPPTGIGVTMSYDQQSDGTIQSWALVTWTASPELLFDEYELQYKLHAASWSTLSTVTSIVMKSGTTAWEIKPLQTGIAYDIRVRAVRSAGPAGGPFFSAWDEIDNQTTVGKTATPTAPSGLTATAGVLLNTLGWTASPDNDIAVYLIYRGATSTFGSASLLDKSLTTGYPDHTATPGTTYYYWAQALDTSGNPSGAIGPASAAALLVDTGNINSNAVTTTGFSAVFNSDQWILPTGNYDYTGPTITTAGYPVAVTVSVTAGNAISPGGMPSGGINAYPYRAPASILIDVYRFDYATSSYTLIASQPCPLGGGEFQMDLVGDQGTSGRATLNLIDSAPAGQHTYSAQFSGYGTYSSSATFTFPITNVMIQTIEQKR